MAPIQPRGDTVKSLSGQLNGLWRFRIGDYRLIYKPQINEHVVILLLVSSRADAYS
jgi:mRNA-degrading endonuclease RelE of RelBE toxin-antitoxin system